MNIKIANISFTPQQKPVDHAKCKHRYFSTGTCNACDSCFWMP